MKSQNLDFESNLSHLQTHNFSLLHREHYTDALRNSNAEICNSSSSYFDRRHFKVLCSVSYDSNETTKTSSVLCCVNNDNLACSTDPNSGICKI